MTKRLPPGLSARFENVPTTTIILVAAGASATIYALLARLGDLRDRLPHYLVAHGALLVALVVVWLSLRRESVTRPPAAPGSALKLVLAAALLFRVIAALGPPALSDDVYRYVWDGRVQLHGVHPYAFAPADTALTDLRDEDWHKINHQTLKTIYPPMAQVWFLLLAALGAGPTGFKLAGGLLDFGVVLALGTLLQRLALPRERVVFYAWNPLVVLETAGSGHIESLGALSVLLSASWIIERRYRLSTLALAVAVHVKLLPALLIPGFLRRVGFREWALLGALLVGLLLPYGLTGPVLGAGAVDYAERWERNASVYFGVRGLLEWIDVGPALKQATARLQSLLGEGLVNWDFVYRRVWPRDIAKLLLGAALLAWIGYVVRRPDLNAARGSFWVLAAAIVISPTVHPWYLVWVLPFAAAFVSWPWLLFAALVPLSYLSGDNDVSGFLRAAQYVPPLGLAIALRLTSPRPPE